MKKLSHDELTHIAKQTLEIEIEALNQLRDELNETIAEVVDLIYRSRGRLVISGVGKSAIVAQKIVATLNSTGTPALYMHAADAIHGDLGMIGPSDVVLLISKSGETPEIKALVPILLKRGLSLVSMTSNQSSFLAKATGYHLYTPISKEADPNNLAPTASTTAQMAMGDALAVCLIRLRGFTVEKFADLHPGGNLGKQLTLTVDQAANKKLLPRVRPNDSIRTAILSISKGMLGATAVIDEQNVLQGIVTDGDLRRMMNQHEDTKVLVVKDIMTAGGYTILGSKLAVEALELMKSKSITQVIIVDQEQHYQGMIHLHDLIHEGLV